MIWLPSRSGRMEASSSASASSAMRRLEVVVGAAQRCGLARVAGGAVRARQLVQLGQLVPGVAHVAAHRRVGPLAAAVAVEAQVQLDQRGDLVDDGLRVAQGRQSPAGQLGPDHLVVVEAHPAAVLEAPGARLADVVQQGGQAQHQVRCAGGLVGGLQVDGLLQHDQGVLVDVLVPVVLVDLQPQGRQLGQHVAGQARCRPSAPGPAGGPRRAAASRARRGPAPRRPS